MILSLLMHLVYEFIFPTFVLDYSSKAVNIIIGIYIIKSIGL